MSELARLQQLFERVADLDPAARAAVLDAECGDDSALRAKLESLLASDQALAGHTARKAVEQLDGLLLGGEPESLVGATVGRYTLIRPLGAGGMGAVYLAERSDGVVQQRVAIKFLARDLLAEGFRERFAIERQVLAQLDHPAITRLIDADQLADGTPYYVMEYVEGQPLMRYVREQRLDLRARIGLLIEVARAVAHAHQALIVHRDLKPGNILVDAQGQPRLLDFGIAKPLAGQLAGQAVSQTITGQRFFSPQHAAPEQLLGEAITVGCDVYGLGTLLYEMLAGQPAIDLKGLSAAEAETKILHQLPEAPSQRLARRDGEGDPPRAWSGQLKGELDAITLTCLRKAPGERYRSVDDLIDDLQAWLEGRPVQARGGHRWYRARKFIGRHRWAVGAATAAAIALLTSSVITWQQSIEAKAQRDAARVALADAEQQRDRAQRVTGFLIDAFAAANPGGELGKDVKARDILERSARQLETDLGDQPELKAQLLATIAEGQRALGLAQDSAATASRAVALVADQGGEAERLARLALAAAEIAARDIPAARLQLDRVRALSSSPAQNASLLLAEQDLMRRLGDYDRSESLYRAFREDFATRLGEVEPALLRRIDINHVGTLQMLKRREEALALAEATCQSLQVATAELQIRCELARLSALRVLERFELALPLSAELVERTRALYGPSHGMYAAALTSHANVLSALGRVDETLPLRREIIAIDQLLNGAESITGLTQIYNLAHALTRVGQLQEGLALLQTISERARRELPDESPSFQFYALAHARALIDAGQSPRAIEVLDAAIADGERHIEASVMADYVGRLKELRSQSAQEAQSQSSDRTLFSKG